VDLGLPPVPHRPDEGFALIGDLLAHSPSMKILVLSGQNDASNARHARALGAAEFVAKPADPVNLKRILQHALQFRAAELSGSISVEEGMLIGRSPAMQKLRSQTSQCADSPFPVLIEGESGSGKEMVATALHHLSSRRDKPSLALNCAAIAPTLVEPTLFGYVKGAFTGAITNKSGYFEDAADGTLFLDEIGELPLELQAKLSPFSLDESAARLWRDYHFPGNVRELRNIVIRLTTKYAGQKLSGEELEPELDVSAVLPAEFGPPSDPDTLIEQAQAHLQRERSFNLDSMLKAWEQGYIEAAMKLTRGNVSQAAKLLGINRTTLYSRMESLQKQ